MKRFILNTLLFTLFTLSLIGLIVVCINVVIYRNAFIKLNPDIKYIVLGHSHPETAFNDSLITQFSNNSASGESYFYTLAKTKLLFKHNNNIETVFIELSNNQISMKMDEWIWGDINVDSRIKFYGPFIDMEGYNLLLKKNPFGLINSIAVSTKKNPFFFINKSFDYKRLGKYFYLMKNKTDSLVRESKLKQIDLDSFRQVSNYNMNYLKKLINFCESKNKKVYLIRSPLHEKYEGYINETIYKNIIATEFKDIEFLDFSKYPLTNAEFADLEHLNFTGAIKFSKWFNKLLNEDNILSKKDKQKYIDLEINQEKAKNVQSVLN